jgi:uncharacterized protein (TIGR01244 family)
MADIRRVTDEFAVAPQIAPEDVPEIARQGFVRLINNRPDGEAPGQPASAALEAAARAAGLDYVHIPFAGRPTPEQARATAEAAGSAAGPALAFCRSGTRSITAWSLGQAEAGARSRAELVELGAGAGYDLSAALGG